MFGFLNPLPPWLNFDQTYSTKSTQPPLLCLLLDYPLPLSVWLSFTYGPLCAGPSIGASAHAQSGGVRKEISEMVKAHY